MTVPDSPAALVRLGALGQLVATAVAVGAWAASAPTVFVAAVAGYLVTTLVGIAGVARAESVVAGPFVVPMILPGFLPLYYLGTR